MKNLTLSLIGLSTLAIAQNAAVSSYMEPQLSGNADIRIREVRIPSSGHNIGTYWCTLGYYTNGATNGYGGVQWTDDNTQGPKNRIYSQWNDFTTADYNAPTTMISLFGGEGTGVKSINNDPNNQWKPDFWHVTADRVWSKGSNSYFGMIFKNGETGQWMHLLTWNTPEANLKFDGGGYTFLEDWRGDGAYRESQLRRGWQHNSDNQSWAPITDWTYTINSGDIGVGGRSYNKRNNWRGGKASDATGEYVYYGAGGSIASTNNSGTTFKIAHTAKTPQEEYGSIALSTLSTTLLSGNRLEVRWSQDPMTVPQWAYKLSISQGSNVLLSKIDTVPQKRIDTLSLGSLNPGTTAYTLSLDVTDFFDGKAQKTANFGQGSSSSSSSTGSSSSGTSSSSQNTVPIQTHTQPTIKLSSNGLEIDQHGLYKVEILNALGQKIFQVEGSGPQSFNTNNLLSGNMYLVRIHGSQGIKQSWHAVP